MNKLFHGFLHVLLIGAQVGNAAAPFVPFPFNVAVAGGIGIVQGALALKNHGAVKA